MRAQPGHRLRAARTPPCILRGEILRGEIPGGVRTGETGIEGGGEYHAAITSLEEAITQSPDQIEAEFAQANPAFPKTAFRTSCRGRTFDEMRVCFDKALKPQACPPAEPECAAAAIVIRPPQ
jgi:hypothetical protein